MTKRITKNALLVVISLVIFILESLIPPIVPLPGIKLGLSNVVTLYIIFELGPIDCFAVLLCRILLSALFTGTVTSLIFSLSGGFLCFLTMLVLKKVLDNKQIFVCGIFAAVFHNVGQILAAATVMKTASVFSYLPVLIISGITTGLFTGIIAQILYFKLKNIR